MLLSCFIVIFGFNDRTTARAGSIIANLYAFAAVRAFLILTQTIFADVLSVTALVIYGVYTIVGMVLTTICTFRVVLLKAILAHMNLISVRVIRRVQVVVGVQFLTILAIAVVIVTALTDAAPVCGLIHIVVRKPPATILTTSVVILTAVLADHQRVTVAVMHLVQIALRVFFAVLAVVFTLLAVIAVKSAADFLSTADAQASRSNFQFPIPRSPRPGLS